MTIFRVSVESDGNPELDHQPSSHDFTIDFGDLHRTSPALLLSDLVRDQIEDTHAFSLWLRGLIERGISL